MTFVSKGWKTQTDEEPTTPPDTVKITKVTGPGKYLYAPSCCVTLIPLGIGLAAGLAIFCYRDGIRHNSNLYGSSCSGSVEGTGESARKVREFVTFTSIGD